ncbi:MAG TPA: TlyA family RNA methyltransferase [Verrucomicrobiaceae bacterium]|jgi:23S rRNA (cytidine1920-2'-O)/16S rRNA (cytidine1409-2'-O)-methyltransferase
MPKIRLDQLLVNRGLCESREKGKRLILAGEVLVNEVPVTKVGQLLPEDAVLRVKLPPKFVSRGGLKLEGALDHFGIEVRDKVCLDIGSSTGGFTDCLLQRGAARVYAFDVGTNQLVWKLRSDPRVVSRENFNVRHMGPADVGEPVDLVVADVSFISLTLVLPPAFEVLQPGGNAVVLIKPQFELSKDEVGKGGIVRDPALHQKACAKIEKFIKDMAESGGGTGGAIRSENSGGLGKSRSLVQWRGSVESPIQGTDGNREFFAWISVAHAGA